MLQNIKNIYEIHEKSQPTGFKQTSQIATCKLSEEIYKKQFLNSNFYEWLYWMNLMAGIAVGSFMKIANSLEDNGWVVE